MVIGIAAALLAVLKLKKLGHELAERATGLILCFWMILDVLCPTHSFASYVVDRDKIAPASYPVNPIGEVCGKLLTNRCSHATESRRGRTCTTVPPQGR